MLSTTHRDPALGSEAPDKGVLNRLAERLDRLYDRYFETYPIATLVEEGIDEPFPGTDSSSRCPAARPGG